MIMTTPEVARKTSVIRERKPSGVNHILPTAGNNVPVYWRRVAFISANIISTLTARIYFQRKLLVSFYQFSSPHLPCSSLTLSLCGPRTLAAYGACRLARQQKSEPKVEILLHLSHYNTSLCGSPGVALNLAAMTLSMEETHIKQKICGF